MGGHLNALLVIATNKYLPYADRLWESVKRFMPDTRLFLFTNQRSSSSSLPQNERVYYVDHEPWPGVTLHRYRTILTAADEIAKCDYAYYCDADMLFTDHVGDEIHGHLVATIHPGFNGHPRASYTYEQNPASRACVPPDQGVYYFAGGFQGGASKSYLRACETMAARIEDDERRGIVACWHDESHWNRYCIDHPPDKILSPLYCSPDSWGVPGRKIVALDKNHSEIRS